MIPKLAIIGDHPFAGDKKGKPKSRIGTLLPLRAALVTLPGIHATQRRDYLELLNRQLQEKGLPPLTRQQETAEWNSAVDLIVEDGTILVRPDPENMQLAFQADELLQQLVPKHRIKFLNVLNRKVRDAIKRRGECWRITPLPTSEIEMKRMIVESRIGIGGREIYYYNKTTGGRFLTCQEFAGLADLDDEGLRRHLDEIRQFSASTNPLGRPEIDFFMAGPGFSKDDFAPYVFRDLDPEPLRTVYARLRQQFFDAVPPAFRQDDPDNLEWRNRMFAALIGQKDEVVSEETFMGLSSEFFMQIRWLPGGRIEEGELIRDPIFDECLETADEQGRAELCDAKAWEFIYNFVREYGDLEYVNVGRVDNSLSRRAESRGRRGVYIVELKQRGSREEIVRVIRMQKWGVREHLEDEKPWFNAVTESEEYTQYVLDRRLGCRQLGMCMPSRVTAGKICERYFAQWTGRDGIVIWSPYFERDYIRGIATDKTPQHRFKDREFSLRFARLLGQAAAPSIIVGRCDAQKKVLFDDGDEVVLEDEAGMPAAIIVSDQTGTFNEYHWALYESAPAYAGPINRRVKFLPDPEEFARVYLEAFLEKFSAIRAEYRRRRRAFDDLFQHRRLDPAGSFAYRWAQVLKRLDKTDPRELAELIREHCVVKGVFLEALQPCQPV